MFVKLCGTTTLEDARLGIASGANALGFIFAPSKRRVTVEQAAQIIAKLPPDRDLVGVFTDADAATILDTAEAANLTTVQLHRPYDTAFIAELADEELALWQVVPFEVNPDDVQASETAFISTLIRALGDPRLSAVLLDTAKAGASGGTGQSFNWKRARTLLDQAIAQLQHEPTARIILAGGLDAQNVATAIEQMQPWGVDAVSGVEAAPGRKDAARVKAFINAARSRSL